MPILLVPNMRLARMTQVAATVQEIGTLTVYRRDVIVATYSKVRVTATRLFAEPSDPYDANVRSSSEWGFTIPAQGDDPIDIEISDRVTLTGRSGGLIDLDLIVGEVVRGDTWESAVRVWATRPKTATPYTTIVISRLGQDGVTFSDLPPQEVQVVYDRVRPESVPLRYASLGHSSYQSGTIIGTIVLDVRLDDRFVIEDFDLGVRFFCVVFEVLPLQPQRREAKFWMDAIGDHS